MNKLQAHKIPIHTLYVDQVAKQNFESIANDTKGKCFFLDIHSSNGEKLLTDLVTQEILRNVGEQRGLGDKLVKAYNAL